VLNDDTVKGGMGFGRHPHNNMEIISIPLSGVLAHGDSMGNTGIIRKGEVQVMSAGTGILHSEKNASHTEEVQFLQIWIFPREQNLEPRYDQISLAGLEKPNDFQQIVSPDKEDDGAWIHQDAWFFIATMDRELSKTYTLKKEGNGVYIFVLEGKIIVGDQVLERRDGLGLTDLKSFDLSTLTKAEVLIMEVPMKLPG